VLRDLPVPGVKNVQIRVQNSFEAVMEIVCGGSLTTSYNNNSPRRADTRTNRHESAVVAMGTFEAFASTAKFLSL
jgi:hypothetical protein